MLKKTKTKKQKKNRCEMFSFKRNKLWNPSFHLFDNLYLKAYMHEQKIAPLIMFIF